VVSRVTGQKSLDYKREWRDMESSASSGIFIFSFPVLGDTKTMFINLSM